MWKHPKNNIISYILGSFFIDFGTFLGSWGLPGTPWSLLGPPLETPAQIWSTKVGPRRVPRGSWSGFWVDLDLLWGPLGALFAKIFHTFSQHLFQEAPKPLFERILHRFSMIFMIVWWFCGLAHKWKTSNFAAIYYTFSTLTIEKTHNFHTCLYAFWESLLGPSFFLKFLTLGSLFGSILAPFGWLFGHFFASKLSMLSRWHPNTSREAQESSREPKMTSKVEGAFF